MDKFLEMLFSSPLSDEGVLNVLDEIVDKAENTDKNIEAA